MLYSQIKDSEGKEGEKEGREERWCVKQARKEGGKEGKVL